MTKDGRITGLGKPSNYAKKQIAQAAYMRGQEFIKAALLLRKSSGYEYVVLHLLCQGFEILIKGLLLMKGSHNSKDLKDIGHNLTKLVEQARSQFRLNPLNPSTQKEVDNLGGWFASQKLRYGGGHDLLIDPATIQSRRFLKLTYAVMRLAGRHMGGPPR